MNDYRRVSITTLVINFLKSFYDVQETYAENKKK